MNLRFSELGLIFLSVFSISHASEKSFPSEFTRLAKSLGCSPKLEAPFSWGVAASGEEKDSAVFWCKFDTDTDLPKSASLVFFIRPGSKAKLQCPHVISNEYTGVEVRVWEPGKDGRPDMKLEKWWDIKKKRNGPKGVLARGKVIENAITRETAGAYYYCYKGSWLTEGYH